MAITFDSGTNLITLNNDVADGHTWGTAWDMEDVLAADVAGSWGVVTKQGANAYDVSARMLFVSGVYFKSTNEFVELQANPTNPAWTFRIDVGAHVQFGEYNSTDKYSYDGCRWDMPALNSGTGNSSSANRIAGEFLVYGSKIITNANNFTKGLMLIAGATVKYYNSIFKYAGYFWAADHDLRDVKWFGGGSTYDMLIAVGFSHNWADLTTMGCNYGLFFSATTTADVDVYDADLLNTGTYSIYLSGSCMWLIRLINSPSFVNTAGISSGRPGLKLCSTFNVKVTDSDGAPIVGATVELKDVDGTVVFSEDTIVGGVLTADKIVTMYWYRNAAQGGNKSFNNHTLKVSSGSDETEYDIDIDHQIKEDVILLPQSVASFDNIMEGINDIKGTSFVKDTDSLVDIRPETDKIQTIDDNIDAIQLKTDNLPTDPADQSLLMDEINKIMVVGEWSELDAPLNLDAINGFNFDIMFYLKCINGSEILAGEITNPGMIYINRCRNGVVTNIISTSFQADNGAVKFNYQFTPTFWQENDMLLLSANNIQVTRNGRLLNVCTTQQKWVQIVQNSKSAEIDAIKLETDKIQTGIIDAKNDYKATGFSTPNEYDTELTNIQSEVNGLNGEAMRGTNSVPTNPLLTNDVRLGNLDAAISSRSDHSAADVWNEDQAKYILGLVQHNFRLKDQVYSGNNMTSATLRIYNNAADCTNDVTPMKEYSIVATYDGNNNCISYRVVE